MADVTQLLNALEQGDPMAGEQLLPLVYAQLRRLAAQNLTREKPGQTLDPTALVHEAYLKLVGDQRFDGCGHFFAAAAEAMRRILVDHARARTAAKRGGGTTRDPIAPDHIAAPAPNDELLALNEALDRLATEHPEHAELVKLRYFAGLTADEAARALGISPSTADRRWAFARAWLRRSVSGAG